MPEAYGDLGLVVPTGEDESTGADVPKAFKDFTDSIPPRLAAFIGGSATLSEDGILSLAAAIMQALVPTATILATARATAPDGFLLCEGQAVSRTTYKTLFEAIGTEYGEGNKSSTFNLPNGVERVLVGKTATGALSTLGAKGGEATHTLSEAEMPIHDHENPSYTGSGVNYGYYGPAGSYVGGTPGSDAGGGEAHNNLQPYQVVNYMIKI